MMWRKVLSVASLLALCAGLSGCGERWSWNQKVTITVDTPEGEKIASSVIHQTMTHSDSRLIPPEARGASSSVSGEAVALEVRPGRYLFALLKNMPSPFEIFFPGQAPVEVADRLEKLRETHAVPSKMYPVLVTFKDISDPMSVQQVDPNNLISTFGSGVTLKSITLSITDEPVSEAKIKDLLPWLGDHPEPKLGPPTNSSDTAPFYRLISYGDFRRQ